MSKYVIVNEDYLAHHGILGMHWGIRRFQPYPKGYRGNGKEVGAAKKVKQRDGRTARNANIGAAIGATVGTLGTGSIPLGAAIGTAVGTTTGIVSNKLYSKQKPKTKKEQISKEEAFNKLRETDRASRAIVGGNRYAEFNTKNAAKRLGVSYDEYKNSKNSYSNSMTDYDRKIVKTSRTVGILFGPISGNITYHNMSKKQIKNADRTLNKSINSKDTNREKAVKKTEQSTKQLQQEINNKVSKTLNSTNKSSSGEQFESLVSSFMKNDGKFKDRKTLDKETQKLSKEYDRLKKSMNPEEAEGYRQLFLMTTIGSYNSFNQKR